MKPTLIADRFWVKNGVLRHFPQLYIDENPPASGTGAISGEFGEFGEEGLNIIARF